MYLYRLKISLTSIILCLIVSLAHHSDAYKSNNVMEQTYLTTEELSSKIKYDPRTIREQLKDSVLFEGIHYIRPFGGRKILFIWERVEKEMLEGISSNALIII